MNRTHHNMDNSLIVSLERSNCYNVSLLPWFARFVFVLARFDGIPYWSICNREPNSSHTGTMILMSRIQWMYTAFTIPKLICWRLRAAPSFSSTFKSRRECQVHFLAFMAASKGHGESLALDPDNDTWLYWVLILTGTVFTCKWIGHTFLKKHKSFDPLYEHTQNLTKWVIRSFRAV